MLQQDNTGLLEAVKESNLLRVKALLANKVDLSTKDGDGCTALHLAVQNKNQKEIVVMLINAGAPINARDGDGWTPLSLAAQIGISEYVALLLQAGANPDIADRDRKSPIALSAVRQYEDVVSILLINRLLQHKEITTEDTTLLAGLSLKNFEDTYRLLVNTTSILCFSSTQKNRATYISTYMMLALCAPIPAITALLYTGSSIDNVPTYFKIIKEGTTSIAPENIDSYIQNSAYELSEYCRNKYNIIMK